MSVHASLRSSYDSYLRSHNKVDKQEALELIRIAQDLNKQPRGCFGLGRPLGDKSLNCLLGSRAFKDHFDSESKDLIRYFLSHHSLPNGDRPATRPTPTQPTRPTDPARPVEPTRPTTPGADKVIIDWKAGQKTWPCHWWPMKPSQAEGDEVNNLFADGGPLAKYDQAFGRNALAEEKTIHVSDVDWHGHCNRAAMVTSLLQEPKNNVTVNGVTFTPHEIKGLLCEIAPNLCTEEELRGIRFDGEPGQSKYDPAPHAFLKDILEPWTKPDQKQPIILDIDPEVAVWNYAFDSVKVNESEKAPEGFAVSTPLGCKTKYYLCEMKSTGFPEQDRNYQFWIQYDRNGTVVSQSWMPMKDLDDGRINPDFGWRVHPKGDLRSGASWKTDPNAADTNHSIFAEDVYRLYAASI